MPRRAAELAIVAIALLAGAVVFTWPLAADPSYTLPAPGDSLYNAWVLGWVAKRTAYALSAVWDTPIFYPYRNTLALAEPMFAIAVPLAPAAWLGANAVLVHNIAVWFSFLVAGTGGYVLGRDLTGRRAAGVVCAAFAAFLPYRVGHLPHVQVLMAGWLWWVVWGVHRYFAAPSLWRALRVGALFILLGLSSLYWLYIGLVPAGVVAAVSAWRGCGRGPARTWLWHGVAAAALCAAAFVPVARPLRSLTSSGSPVSGTVDRKTYSADVLGFVSGQSSSMVWGSILHPGNGEADLFPGLTVVACALLALVRPRRTTSSDDGVPRTRPEPTSAVDSVPGTVAGTGDRPGAATAPSWTAVYVVLLVVGVLLSLGPSPAFNGRPLFENPIFGWLSAILPGFAQLRASARFAVIAQLALSVLAAIGVAAWLERRRTSATEAAVTSAVAAALIFVEGLALPVSVFAFSPYQRAGDRSTFYWLSQHPGGAVLELPLDGWGPIDYSMVYQHRTLVHGHPIVSGVSRFNPPLAAMLGDPDSPLVDPALADEAVAFLRVFGVRYVVVHPVWFRSRSFGEATRDAYVAASGASPRHFGESTIIDLGEPNVAASAGAATATDGRASVGPGSGGPAAAGGVAAGAAAGERAGSAGDARVEELPVASMQVTATSGQVERMLDGDTASRWLTGQPQRGDERIDIALSAPRVVTGLRLQLMGRSLNDYPRGLTVSVSADGTTYVEVRRGSVFAALGAGLRQDAVAPTIDLRWPPVAARFVRLQQTGRTGRRWFWSVHELRLLTVPTQPDRPRQ
jgi:hypothetical protein